MVINVKMKKSLTGVLLSLILVESFVTPAVSVLAADEATEPQVVEPAPAVETTEEDDIPSPAEKEISVVYKEGEKDVTPGEVVYLKKGGSINISAKPVEGYEPVKIAVTFGFTGYEVEGSTLTIKYEDVKYKTFILVRVFYRKVTPPTTEQRNPEVMPPTSEAPKPTEQPKSEVPKSTPPATEAPKATEQPKSETPKSTSSSTEAPNAEEPKVTPPATANPEVTPPTTEAPKTAEQPKSEEPKTTEQKKALPNTGEAPSMLATISAILLGFVGIIGFNYKQEN